MTNMTNHGEKRMRKRMGLSKKALDKAYGEALLYGRHQREFKGSLKKYLDSKAEFYKATPIIHGHFIYWTSRGQLITVYQVPPKFKKYL